MTAIDNSNASIWMSDGSDENYKWYKTQDSCKELREWMDKAYFEEGLNQYLDSDFLYQLRNNDFFARLWELELAEWLWLTKLKLVPTNGSGPDFCIDLQGRKIWIEAVLASADEALDKKWRDNIISPGASAKLYDFPKDEHALRYASALYTKATKIKAKYVDKNIISENDFVVIAVSGFTPGALHSDIEHFMRAVLPMGDPVVHFSLDGKSLDQTQIRPSHTNQAEYVKTNGSVVLKQFLYPGTHFPFIDAVMFAEASNLQQLLGVWSNRFNESTNIPHVFPNHASSKTLDSLFTDNFYFHKFVNNPSFVSVETIEPLNKL